MKGIRPRPHVHGDALASVPADTKLLASRIEGDRATETLQRLTREVLPIFGRFANVEPAPIVSLAIPPQHPVARWFRHPMRRAAVLESDLVLARRVMAGAIDVVVLRVRAEEPPVAFSVCLSRISGLVDRVLEAAAVAITLPDKDGRPDLTLLQVVPVQRGMFAMMVGRAKEMASG